MGRGYLELADQAETAIARAASGDGETIAVVSDGLGLRLLTASADESRRLGKVVLPNRAIGPTFTYGNGEGPGLAYGLIPHPNRSLHAFLNTLRLDVAIRFLLARLGEPTPEMLPAGSGVRPALLGLFDAAQFVPLALDVTPAPVTDPAVIRWSEDGTIPALGIGVNTDSQRWKEIAAPFEALPSFGPQELAEIEGALLTRRAPEREAVHALHLHLRAVEELAKLLVGPGDYFFIDDAGTVQREAHKLAATHLQKVISARNEVGNPFWVGRDGLVFLDRLESDPLSLGGIPEAEPKFRPHEEEVRAWTALETSAEVKKLALMRYLHAVAGEHGVLRTLPLGKKLGAVELTGPGSEPRTAAAPVGNHSGRRIRR